MSESTSWLNSVSYYSVAELAVLSGLSRDTIRGYILKGRIRATKLDGQTGSWFIAVPDGDAFLEALARPVAA